MSGSDVEKGEKMADALRRPLSKEQQEAQRRAWNQLTPEERERLIPTDPEQIEVVSGGKKQD